MAYYIKLPQNIVTLKNRTLKKTLILSHFRIIPGIAQLDTYGSSLWWDFSQGSGYSYDLIWGLLQEEYVYKSIQTVVSKIHFFVDYWTEGLSSSLDGGQRSSLALCHIHLSTRQLQHRSSLSSERKQKSEGESQDGSHSIFVISEGTLLPYSIKVCH